MSGIQTFFIQWPNRPVTLSIGGFELYRENNLQVLGLHEKVLEQVARPQTVLVCFSSTKVNDPKAL